MLYASLLIALIPASAILLGIRIILKEHKVSREIEKDEFERRGSGGLLEYTTFEESKAAQRHKMANNGRSIFGLFLTIAGAGFLIAVIVQWNDAVDHANAEQEDEWVKQCDAAIQGPPGGDLTPCRKLCRMPDYKEGCRKMFGHEDGPPVGLEDKYR